MTEPASAAPRDQFELATAQLRAIDAWNQAQRLAEDAARSAAVSREMRLDVTRRAQARRREHAALLARAAEQLQTSGDLLTGDLVPRALIAHRSEWVRNRVAGRLAGVGVRVVGVFEDGADAAGTLVVEQPDLLLVEDRLPTLSGLDVVRRARTFSPATVVGAQTPDASGFAALVDAGAAAVFTRRVPPDEIADQLVTCLRHRQGVPAHA